MAAQGGGVEEREVQKKYWMEHSADLTVEAMMLDSQASDLDKEERPEVLSLLPPYEGKFVLELGAGIGRFTGELAKKAGEVLALDFIESVIKKNESINGHFKNVKFMCADVTSPDLNMAPDSVDLIFSNWLLMYLSDKEVEDLVEKMMKWVKVGGHIFFRESCFHQSGDHKRKCNPTHYREPRFYTKVFKDSHIHDASGDCYELELVGCKCIGAYVKNKKNQNQICWIWQKVQSEDDKGFQKFLDNVQYKCSGILRYERAFGQGFVSTGGIETTKEFVSMLDLKPGQKVLDVGCGIGGGDFYMAETYDVEVFGIDLSVRNLKANVERTKLVQVGFTVFDPVTSEIGGVWQFNMAGFSTKLHDHAPDSIKMLEDCGIDFEENFKRGVRMMQFTRLLKLIREVFGGNISWVTFHGLYDVGYFLAALSGVWKLPNEILGFADAAGAFFTGGIFDLKTMAGRHSWMGLEKFSAMVGEAREEGKAHQAGSDSLLTAKTFARTVNLMTGYYGADLAPFRGILFGIKVPMVSVRSCKYYVPVCVYVASPTISIIH